MDHMWLDWARRLQAIAQNGLAYGKDAYDIERFEAVRHIAAEILAAHSDVAPAYVRDLFAGDVGHATPKIDVRGVVFHQDKLLLVRERADGLWTLPGGWADAGESPSEAIVRETYEESGYRTRAVKLLALYDRDRHGHTPLPYYVYKLFFRCELADDAAPPSTEGHIAAHAERPGAAYAEITDVGFFGQDELPALSVSRVTAAQLYRFFDHYRHPDWPTDFD